MSKFDDINNGDKVSVLIEGIARKGVSADNLEIRVGDGAASDLIADVWDEGDHIIDVQIIEPEYDRFAPGDLVRYELGGKDTVFALGVEGFLITTTGRFVRYGEAGARRLDQFTTENFVQVFIP